MHPLDILNPHEKPSLTYLSHIFSEGQLLIEYEHYEYGCNSFNVSDIVEELSYKNKLDYDGYGIMHRGGFLFKVVLFHGDKESGYLVDFSDKV